MNIWVNMSDFAYDHSDGKAFPLLYFWLKDHYYQKSPENFKRTNWNWHEDSSKSFYEDPSIKEKLDKNPPDVYLLSLYLWNDVLLLMNARFIKENYPNCLVVTGGPSAQASKKFFEQHPYVDMSIIGPGQEIVRRLIDNKFDGREHNTPGVAYFKQEELIKNKPIDRKENIVLLNHVNNFRAEVKQVADDMVKSGHSIIWLSLLIQGCPYTCTFCEQGTHFWGKIQKRPLRNLLDEIDFLTDYDPVHLSFIDSNIGIHEDYVELYEYIVKKKTDLNWNVDIILGDYAKNNIERVTYLQRLASKHGLRQQTGMIALQDTDLDVLKMNGRPGDKDFVKIDAYAKVIKEQPGRPNTRVDIIIGMPGQSFASLTTTLVTLVKKEIIESMAPPNMFYVLPNTRLTMGDEFPNIKTRMIRRRAPGNYGIFWIDPEDSANKFSLGQETIIETDTLPTRDLVTMWYLFPAFGFMNYIQYFDTANNYLKNFHGVDPESFYRSIIDRFSPINFHKIPNNIRQDIESVEDLLLGKTKYLERKDNHGLGYLNMDRMAIYRVMANQNEWLGIIKDVLNQLTHHDANVTHIIQWMKHKTISMDFEHPRSLISLNWDDIVQNKKDLYYQSRFTFDFDCPNNDSMIQKIKYTKDIQYIATVKVSEAQDPGPGISIRPKEIVKSHG